MIVAILLPSTGRAEQMKARVNDLLMQPPVEGVELWVILAPPEGDKATVAAANDLRGQWDGSDVTVVVAKREANTTAVEGWSAAYKVARGVADWLVLGADDIIWHPGWLASALEVAEKTGAQVVGLHDGHTNLRHYGAHYMASLEFVVEHLGDMFIPPMYKSWWFDREVCEKADGLGLYAAAWGAMAEHTHPDWGNAPMDDTYKMAWALHDQDRAVYEERKAAGFPVDYVSAEVEAPAKAWVTQTPDVIDATDAAVKLADEHDIALATITGTGTDGRIIKSDVEAAIKESDE